MRKDVKTTSSISKLIYRDEKTEPERLNFDIGQGKTNGIERDKGKAR